MANAAPDPLRPACRLLGARPASGAAAAVALANRLDELLALELPGPAPLNLRLAEARTLRLAGSLELAARESARCRRTPGPGALLAAAAELRAGLTGRTAELPTDELAARPKSVDRASRSADLLEARLAATLARLPFTWPEELAEAPEAFLCVSQDEVEALTSIPTSGSQGRLKRVFSSAEDLEGVVSFFQFGMRHLVEPGRDRPALLMNGGRPGTVGWLLEKALARWDVPLLIAGFLDFARLDAVAAELAEARVTCLVGLPWQLLALARGAVSRRPAALQTVLLSGEAAPQALKQALTDEWGAEVFVHYGLTEFGLGGAVECRCHGGPHLREADLAVEIVDADGRALPPGQAGEIVVTSLSRRAMPLLRYRTGDLGLMAPDACPCGSVMRRLRPLGRLADRLTLPDGRLTSLTELGELLPPFAAGCRLGWRPSPPLLRAAFAVRPGTGPANRPSGGPSAAEARRLRQDFLAFLGPGVELELVFEELAQRPGSLGAKNVLAALGPAPAER
ncbi:MAG: AMP-binding protein [Deltaproteobacteria bacterium]|jgi:hypothetical protein|nr:AMP-binding protein [Deltaproteobacteria bacterium]